MVAAAETLLVKTGGSAAVRALGWAGRRIKDRNDEQRTRKRLDPPIPIEAVAAALESAPEPARNALRELLQSAEIEQLAFSLATDHVLHVCGKRVEGHRREILCQLTEMVRLGTEGKLANPAQVAAAIFQVIDAAVAERLGSLNQDPTRLPPELKASLIKSATSLSAAALRNSELLASLHDLGPIRQFERDFRAQMQNVHGSMRLPHAGTTRQVPYERLFVQPHVVVHEIDAPARPTTLTTVMSSALRVVMLGNPGGGKSTSSLKLTYEVAAGKTTLPVAVPFLVVLRNYAERISTGEKVPLVEYLHDLCEFPYGVTAPPDAIEYLLMNGRALLVFDGLDELLDVSLRRDVVQAVEAFCHRYPTTSVLVTSREVGYTEAPLDPDLFVTCSLQSFDDDQVEAYVRKWFSLDESIEEPRKGQLADAFLTDSQFVADLRVNPLMLSLMCGIYASENYIPRNRPDVYEKCALLLFDRWDKQRGINAPLAFDAHVQAAMRSLALWLYPKQEAQEGLPRLQLVGFMKNYLLEKRFDEEAEAENAAIEFIDFCKGRAWVLTDVGAETYGFTHRTFLEYFAASQLVKQNANAEALFIALAERIRHAEWDMLAQLAVQILGKTVEDGADDFLELVVQDGMALSGRERDNCLAFAARALEFIVPRPPVLQVVVEAAVNELASRGADAPLSAIIAATPENLPLITRYLKAAVEDALLDGRPDECRLRALALALYPTLYEKFRPGRAVSSRNREHWASAGLEAEPAVRSAVDQYADTVHWVGRWAVMSLRLPLEEYLKSFGVAGMFWYEMPTPAKYLPFGSMTLHAYLGRRDNDGGVPPPWLDKAAVEALLSALKKARAPWVGLDKFGTIWTPFDIVASLDRFDPTVRSILVLLAMAHVEASEVYEPNMSSGNRLNRLAKFVGRGGNVRSLKSFGSLDSDVEYMVEKWVRYELRLVSRRGGRTQRTGSQR